MTSRRGRLTLSVITDTELHEVSPGSLVLLERGTFFLEKAGGHLYGRVDGTEWPILPKLKVAQNEQFVFTFEREFAAPLRILLSPVTTSSEIERMVILLMEHSAFRRVNHDAASYRDQGAGQVQRPGVPATFGAVGAGVGGALNAGVSGAKQGVIQVSESFKKLTSPRHPAVTNPYSSRSADSGAGGSGAMSKVSNVASGVGANVSKGASVVGSATKSAAHTTAETTKKLTSQVGTKMAGLFRKN